MGKITAFLPCRAGSERVPQKNIKKFYNYDFGLIEVKLNQLGRVEGIDEIVLSTNDADILKYAETLKIEKLRVHTRDEQLSSSQTSTDQLVNHALDLIPEGDILWTHVTSPFVTDRHYSEIINCYKKKKEKGYDSLMTVNEVYSFLWQDGEPLNYDRNLEKWPRTQTLKPVNEVNSAVFLAPSKIYEKQKDRIGKNPYLYKLDKIISHDIDWPEDFIIAECLVEKGIASL
ncbi:MULTISPECIES: acylneuraminate cytidylyltransferase family protein [Psychrobacter]|uniref:acylneuraminate cytidylyltransferase family protein n=1 Tax=Psychrobacter TaxID=497 RepID=UPI000ED32CF5|nr:MULTISPECIES: acylneuraminate cytidylyltransferase family protein [Psychrobacter]HCN16703.1 acylneuraminate cytidylyltransferase [Psychrobacter sp.]